MPCDYEDDDDEVIETRGAQRRQDGNSTGENKMSTNEDLMNKTASMNETETPGNKTLDECEGGSGNDASCEDASGDDASGDDASGDDASGDDASGDDASGDDSEDYPTDLAEPRTCLNGMPAEYCAAIVQLLLYIGHFIAGFIILT